MPLATPINLILFSLFLVLVYLHFRSKSPLTLPQAPPPIVFRTFTPTTLLPFNGTQDKPVYLAVRGRVFDVTPGRGFYGPVIIPGLLPLRLLLVGLFGFVNALSLV